MHTTVAIDRLRDARGAFSMVAIDQRASLREMLTAGRGRAADDGALVTFKRQVAAELSTRASAILVDRRFGTEAARVARCPVILAADVLFQSSPGRPVDRAVIDDGIDEEVIDLFRPAALKMLVPWTPSTRSAAIDLSNAFMDRCRSLRLPGVVEGVVRPPDLPAWSAERRDHALVAAAADLATTHPDLYKGEVPSFGRAPAETMTSVARRMTEVLRCPWVVLSSGVPAERFPFAVAACRAGGADGFLAGRAIWADATVVDDPEQFLRTTAVRRLERMAAS